MGIGQSGSFTIDNYADNMDCFIDFGSQCSENGAVIEFTHLSVQDAYYGDYTYETYHQQCGSTSPYADAAKFAYTASDGTQIITDEFCGCMHDLDIDYALFYDSYKNP